MISDDEKVYINKANQSQFSPKNITPFQDPERNLDITQLNAISKHQTEAKNKTNNQAGTPRKAKEIGSPISVDSGDSEPIIETYYILDELGNYLTDELNNKLTSI